MPPNDDYAQNDILPEMLDRLARVIAAGDWSPDLNPAQRAALTYLMRANRFSRSPSHVADYLCTTRGTASQTLKALEKKGLIEKASGAGDRRSFSYAVTKAGQAVAIAGSSSLAVETLTSAERDALASSLQKLMRETLKQQSFRSFGVCRTCRHHQPGPSGGYCDLLQTPLLTEETSQICHEHAAA